MFGAFTVSIIDGVGRFLPMIMVVDRKDVTSASYWKGLPLCFERQKDASGHKSSKKCLTVMCCGNATGNHELKLAVIGKAKKTTIIQGYQRKLHSCSLLQPERSMDG
jgi:hypothetical protein